MATQNGNPADRQPVTSHPTFPLLVALWFGALFGLGSLAVRPALLEQLVLQLGIDTVIAAAAPPLGTTFRILLALTMAGVGTVIGAVVARRLRSQPVPGSDLTPRRARDAHPDAPPRRPISAREEFAEDAAVILDADGPQTLPGRRRALAISDDGPSEFHELAPLPGGGSHGFDATARLDALVEKLGPAEHRKRPEQGELHPQPESLVPAESGTGAAFAPPQDAVRDSNDDLPFGRPPEMTEPPFAQPEQEGPDLEEPTLEEPVEGEGVAADEPVSHDCRDQNAPQKPASAAESLIGRPLEHLSAAELSERLAIALDQRRLRQSQAASVRQAAASAAGALAPAAGVASKEPDAASPSKPTPVEQQFAALPAALRPLELNFTEEAADDDSDSSPLLQRRFGLSASSAGHCADRASRSSDQEDELDEGTLANGYSSLLDLSRPSPLRSSSSASDTRTGVDDGEPVVTFPGQEARRAAASTAEAEAPAPPLSSVAAAALRRFDAPAGDNVPTHPASPGLARALDRDEADRALRAALATLQRMSGAA